MVQVHPPDFLFYRKRLLGDSCECWEGIENE
nr:MAG TPA: hypothetical protein [Caudoviricetes sp.]